MSKEYNEYLKNHISNVEKAYVWLRENFPDLHLKNVEIFHDFSKYLESEYTAYDEYFYGGYKNEDAFNYAWLHHIHRNPHHWQYWVLIGDDEPIKPLEMPAEYVIEMFCDWWSFSFAKGDLYEVFKWYEIHKDKMILHPKTRNYVEFILKKVKEKLDETNGEGDE